MPFGSWIAPNPGARNSVAGFKDPDDIMLIQSAELTVLGSSVR